MCVVLSDSLKSLIEHDEYIELRALLKNVDLSSIKDSNNRTLLHYGALYNNLRMTKLFIESHCDIEAKDNSGITPIFLAAENNSLDAMGMLINAGADIFYTTPDGRSTLATIFCSQKEIPGNILSNVLEVIKNTYTSDAEVADVLMKAQFPFHSVVSVKNSDITRMMLDGGCPVNDHNRDTDKTALQEAMLLQDVENVKVLLKYNAAIHIDNKVFILAFHQSINDYTIEGLQVAYLIIERLTKSHLLNEYGYFLLGLIFKLSKKDVIQTFLELDIDLHGKDIEGKTLLHYLAVNKSKGTIELLHNKIFDVNTKDKKGHTALYYAVAYATCNANSVEFLLKKGAQIGSTDEEVYSLLAQIFPDDKTKYIRLNHKECIEHLLLFGANPQVLSKSNKTFISLVLSEPCRNLPVLVKPIIAHIVLLRDINKKPIHDSVFKVMAKLELNDYYRTCLEEIKKMKGYEVVRGITLFQILCERKEQIKEYIQQDQSLLTLMDREDLRELNSYYKLRLENNINNAAEKY